MSKPRPLILRVKSRVRLSFFSSLAGWSVGMVLLASAALIPSKKTVDFADFLGYLLLASVCTYICVMVVWFFVLLPLSLFVPARSFLWKPWILTILGVLSGPIIAIAYAVVKMGKTPASLTDLSDYLLIFILPAVMGGTTCYVGARLNTSWDREFEADVKAGKLDTLGKEADKDFDAGRCKPL